MRNPLEVSEALLCTCFDGSVLCFMAVGCLGGGFSRRSRRQNSKASATFEKPQSIGHEKLEHPNNKNHFELQNQTQSRCKVKAAALAETPQLVER